MSVAEVGGGVGGRDQCSKEGRVYGKDKQGLKGSAKRGPQWGRFWDREKISGVIRIRDRGAAIHNRVGDEGYVLGRGHRKRMGGGQSEIFRVLEDGSCLPQGRRGGAREEIQQCSEDRDKRGDLRKRIKKEKSERQESLRYQIPTIKGGRKAEGVVRRVLLCGPHRERRGAINLVRYFSSERRD